MNLTEKNKEFVWNLIGTSFNSLNSLFFLIIVTRINGESYSGIFNIAFSLACLFFIVGTYAGRVYQVTDFSNKFSNKEYIIQRIFTCSLMLILAIIYSFIMKYDSYKFTLVILLCFLKVLEAFSEVLYGILQKQHLLHIVGKSLTLKSIVSIILFIFIDMFTKNLLLSCLVLNIVWIVIIFFFDIPNTRKIIDKKESKSILNVLNLSKCGIFMFAVMFLCTYLVNAPKYALDGNVSNALQGVFGMVFMPATVVGLATQYFLHPFLKDLTDSYVKREESKFYNIIKKLIIYIIFIGITTEIAVYLLGVPVLNIIYGIDLTNYRLDLLIIILGATFNSLCTVFSTVLTTINRTFIQFIIYLITTIVSIIIYPILINSLGVHGASYGYLVIMVVQFTLFTFISFYVLKSNEYFRSK